MSGARKIMNSAQEIIITEEDRREAEALVESMTFEPLDAEKYQKVLDRYCEEFGASSYYDLMSRADVAEFSGSICTEILHCYSMVTHSINH